MKGSKGVRKSFLVLICFGKRFFSSFAASGRSDLYHNEDDRYREERYTTEEDIGPAGTNTI